MFEVKQGENAKFPNFISVGRTSNNDVVVPDASLSKFHAFFKEAGADIVVQDSGSKNGTFVNDNPVPAKDAGDGLVVASGDSVRFGTVRLSFLTGAQFYDFVRAFS